MITQNGCHVCLFSVATSFVFSGDANYVAYAQMLLCSIFNSVWMILTGMFLQFEHSVVVISAEVYAGHMTAATALVFEVQRHHVLGDIADVVYLNGS